VIPLFPELRPYLEDAFDPEAIYVAGDLRQNTNVATTMAKIIKRAGIKPWPKLFQNLRSTRETELNEEYPMHVVCYWIGNSRQALPAGDRRPFRARNRRKKCSASAAVPTRNGHEPGCILSRPSKFPGVFRSSVTNNGAEGTRTLDI
jgi:hypothetical protein